MDFTFMAGLTSAVIVSLAGISFVVLAPRNIILTYIDESWGRIVMRFGARKKILLQWAGYILEKELDPAKDWDIVIHPDIKKRKRTRKERIFGGLGIVGIPGIDWVYIYNLRWPGIKLTPEGTLEMFIYDETLDHFLAKSDLYALKMLEVETAMPERVKTTVTFQFPMRIKNPRKAFFEAPPNVLENTLARLGGWFRPWIGNKHLDELWGLKGTSLELQQFDQFVAGGSTVEKELGKWGMSMEGPVQIRDLKPPTELTEAIEAERKAEWLAKASSESVMRFFLHSLALVQGKTVEEIQREFALLPVKERQKRLYPFLEEMARIRLALDKKAYFEIRTEGGKAGDISGAVREFIATSTGLVAKVLREGGAV